MLLRVLPSVYPKQPGTIHHHLGNLTAMMPQLESTEQQHLIRLIQMVAEQHPLVSFCADELTIYCGWNQLFKLSTIIWIIWIIFSVKLWLLIPLLLHRQFILKFQSLCHRFAANTVKITIIIYIKCCDRLLKCFYFLVFMTGGIINLFSALHHLNASHHIVQTV